MRTSRPLISDEVRQKLFGGTSTLSLLTSSYHITDSKLRTDVQAAIPMPVTQGNGSGAKLGSPSLSFSLAATSPSLSVGGKRLSSVAEEEEAGDERVAIKVPKPTPNLSVDMARLVKKTFALRGSLLLPNGDSMFRIPSPSVSPVLDGTVYYVKKRLLPPICSRDVICGTYSDHIISICRTSKR